jgi:hypothetical protein
MFARTPSALLPSLAIGRPFVLTAVDRALPLRTVIRAALAAATPGRALRRETICS